MAKQDAQHAARRLVSSPFCGFYVAFTTFLGFKLRPAYVRKRSSLGMTSPHVQSCSSTTSPPRDACPGRLSLHMRGLRDAILHPPAPVARP